VAFSSRLPRSFAAAAAHRFVSVLEPRYIPEHMFVSVQIAEPNEQGGDPWT